MHSGTTIFCLRCGHENPASNRFCGMCGGELVRPRSAESMGESYGDGEPGHAAPPHYEPAEYQPSFGYRYPEEEPHGHWKLYLFAAIVAIAGFVIAYQWGKPNFDTSRILTVLQRPEKKMPDENAAPAAESASRPETSMPEGGGSAGATGTSANQTGANTAPGAATPQPSPPPQGATAARPSQAEDANAAPAGNAARAGNGAERGLSEQDIPPGQVPPAPDTTQQPTSRSTPANAAPAEEPSEDETPSEEARVSPPTADKERRGVPANRKSVPDAEADSAPPAVPNRQQQAASDLLVDTAQNYLYGRGVPKDCDRALSYLRRAADASVRAKTQLGAMYATGQCVPQDRPTAYHWMALAYRADPRNSYLEHDLQMLWSQMTAEEKQRALRLTQ